LGSFTQDGVAMGRVRRSLRVLLGPLLLVLAAAPNSTESAIANGDTRTLTLSDAHTNESGSFTYKVDGYYDSAVLEKLNWFLRDWRLNESTKMDPKLFDILWQVYRESGSQQPVDILSAYRSPQTNAMLRRRSRQVAEHSQHMEGRAVDAHFLDVGTATIRDITMRMQAGGVGFYPTGGTPWVHIDCGSIRYWPRMSRDALTRLFPDGKTVFIPSDGQPMAGYEQARAEIEARGGEIQTASKGSGFGFLGFLFGARGGGADDEEETGADNVVTSGRGFRSGRGGIQVASVAPTAPDVPTSARGNLPRGQTYAEPAPPAPATPDVLATARGNLPRGQVYVQAAPSTPPDQAPAPAAAPSAAPAPEAVDGSDTDTAAEASPVSLHGPIAAKFIAPLPPRKPAGLIDVAEAVPGTPLPPTRPVVASEEGKPASLPPSSNRDLVAALLERGKLPHAITRGVGAAPSNALALADPGAAAPEPPDRPALLARAAALTAPLPPARPVLRASARPSGQSVATETSVAPRTPASSARPASAERPRKDATGHGASLTNPYGELILDAFNVARPAAGAGAASLPDGLRGPAQ
jgi:uncharacterized protein YcbK (DUF882 family)